MNDIRLIEHAPGAPGLRWFGLGPNLQPANGLEKLKLLFDHHSFWAKQRSYKQLRQMLAGSSVIVTAWDGKQIVGFGRATSDGIFRAVLWDIVVLEELQGQGIGKKVLKSLFNSKAINQVERVYLMTTNGADFYRQLDFEDVTKQKLLWRRRKNY